MNGSFTLYPHNGQLLDVSHIRQFLLSHVAVVPAEHRQEMLIVAADQEEADRIRDALKEDPKRPRWAIFIDLTPERMLVYREAPQETLDNFRPLLKDILSSGAIGTVKDEEGRVMSMDDIDELCRELLA